MRARCQVRRGNLVQLIWAMVSGIGEAEEKEGLGTAIENKVVSKLSWQFNIESDRYEESAVG